VPPPCSERYIAPPNQNYMGALVTLQTSIENVAGQGQPNDAAAAQTLSNATQAKVTTRQMAQAFRLDSEGHIEAGVQKLLEDPIVYAEALLRTLGPAELNGKGKALCTQIRPVLAKYPFTATATVQATIDDINAVFKPKDGAIWQFYDANLQKALPRQGSQFAPSPTAGLQINSAFIGFLSRAAAFSDAAYAGGAAEPRLSYAVKLLPSQDIDAFKVQVDGQSGDFAAGGAAKQFLWPGPGPHGLQYTIRLKGGSEVAFTGGEGLWSVFQFVNEADRHTGTLIETTPRSGRAGRPALNPASGQPIVLRIDISVNPPVFDKGYFSGFGCVADIAKP
jgi:type VI protein secretion system component VasK